MPAVAPCPRCQQAATLNESNRWRPFCSERCQMKDIGDWASERYRVATDSPIVVPESEPDQRQ